MKHLLATLICTLSCVSSGAQTLAEAEVVNSPAVAQARRDAGTCIAQAEAKEALTVARADKNVAQADADASGKKVRAMSVALLARAQAQKNAAKAAPQHLVSETAKAATLASAADHLAETQMIDADDIAQQVMFEAMAEKELAAAETVQVRLQAAASIQRASGN